MQETDFVIDPMGTLLGKLTDGTGVKIDGGCAILKSGPPDLSPEDARYLMLHRTTVTSSRNGYQIKVWRTDGYREAAKLRVLDFSENFTPHIFADDIVQTAHDGYWSNGAEQ